MDKLYRILPFIEDEEVKELAIKIINEEIKGVKLHAVFPFLAKEDLDQIIDMLIEKGKSKELKYALPFMSQESLIKLYEKVKTGEITGLDENYFFPFLGKDKLKQIFDDMIKSAAEMSDDEEEDEESEED